MIQIQRSPFDILNTNCCYQRYWHTKCNDLKIYRFLLPYCELLLCKIYDNRVTTTVFTDKYEGTERRTDNVITVRLPYCKLYIA